MSTWNPSQPAIRTSPSDRLVAGGGDTFTARPEKGKGRRLRAGRGPGTLPGAPETVGVADAGGPGVDLGREPAREALAIDRDGPAPVLQPEQDLVPADVERCGRPGGKRCREGDGPRPTGGSS